VLWPHRFFLSRRVLRPHYSFSPHALIFFSELGTLKHLLRPSELIRLADLEEGWHASLTRWRRASGSSSADARHLRLKTNFRVKRSWAMSWTSKFFHTGFHELIKNMFWVFGCLIQLVSMAIFVVFVLAITIDVYAPIYSVVVLLTQFVYGLVGRRREVLSICTRKCRHHRVTQITNKICVFCYVSIMSSKRSASYWQLHLAQYMF
jgi:hypothetical protein